MTGVAFIRRPSPRLADGLLTHIDRQPVDVDLAFRQWVGYVDTLRSHGWEIVEVEPADDCPDVAFLEDTAVVFGTTVVVCRPGAPERRAEVPGTAAALAERGLDLREIQSPGALDGGDVLKVGGRVYVGLSGRTNQAGIDQLTDIVTPLGYEVTPVPTTKVLHLKSAVTALPDERVIGYEPVVDDSEVFHRFLAVPEEPGAHVVLLGDDKLLMAESAPRSARMFADLGYEPVTVDISEFEKLEGCVTCLSIRLRT